MTYPPKGKVNITPWVSSVPIVSECNGFVFGLVLRRFDFPDIYNNWNIGQEASYDASSCWQNRKILKRHFIEVRNCLFHSLDILVINKTDLAPHVGASLAVMEHDSRMMRGDKPFLFTNCRTGEGIPALVDLIVDDLLFDLKLPARSPTQLPNKQPA
jgi:hypothetical protein